MTKESGWRRQQADEELELLRRHWGGLPFWIKLRLYWLAIYEAGHNYGLDAPIKRAILTWLLTLSIASLNRYLHTWFLHQGDQLWSNLLLYTNLATKAITYFFLYQFIRNMRYYYRYVLGGK